MLGVLWSDGLVGWVNALVYAWTRDVVLVQVHHPVNLLGYMAWMHAGDISRETRSL